MAALIWVTFSHKDYKPGSIKKEMTLDAREFIRRFSMHILPKGFVRIRHYGIVSSSSKQINSVIIKEQVSEKDIALSAVISKIEPVV